MTNIEKKINDIIVVLLKDVIENPLPPHDDAEKLIDIFEFLQKKVTPHVTSNLLQTTNIGKIVNKSSKTFKRHKRTADMDSNGYHQWEELYNASVNVIQLWKQQVDKEVAAAAAAAKKKKAAQQTKMSQQVGLPKTVSEYRTRLITQKKELYKDPPMLPPTYTASSRVTAIDKNIYPLPKRNPKTMELTFVAGKSDDGTMSKLLKDFKPNRTPLEVLAAGSFGGTYFRSIISAVTNIHYNGKDVLKDTFPKHVVENELLPKNKPHNTWLTSSTYRSHINKYGVKCGGSLDMWESSGWISEYDPYGWFQWYCRFYYGRRIVDEDKRQILRWLKSVGPKGRFKSQLCNKISKANTHIYDNSISPVIRQTLLHWGVEITPSIYQAHLKRIKLGK